VDRTKHVEEKRRHPDVAGQHREIGSGAGTEQPSLVLTARAVAAASLPTISGPRVAAPAKRPNLIVPK
jgi:hypothetical protein